MSEGAWTEADRVDYGQPTGSLNFLNLVLDHKWVVLLGLLLGGGLGYLYYLQQEPVYKSSARVLVIAKYRNPLPVQSIEGQQLFYEDYLATHIRLIRSPVIVSRAVQRGNLGALPSFAGKGDPTGGIVSHLEVQREERTNILSLSYSGPVAEDCAAVLNAVLDSYEEFLGQTYHDVSQETVEDCARAKDELKKELEEKEREYVEFLRTAPLIWNGQEGANVHQQRLATIEQVRFQAVMRCAQIEASLQALEKALAEGKPNQIQVAWASYPAPYSSGKGSDNVIVSLEQQLYPLVIQRQMLLQRYGVNHPEVVSLQKQINFIRDFFLKKGPWFQEGGELAVLAENSEGGQSDSIPSPVQTYISRSQQQLQTAKSEVAR